MKRSPALDVVRGLAILLVLIWHYMPRTGNVPDFLLVPTRLFWSGVDLFFVLSGFLIGGILLQNVGATNYFQVFYIRRAARILPLYILLCLSFALLLSLRFDTLMPILKVPLPFWSYLTFTQNFLYASRQRFGDPWMDVTWSLAVEEQFYIFLSIFMKKLGSRKLTFFTIGLILLAPILRIFSNLYQGYILPLQRADALMLGVLLTLIWNNPRGQDWLRKNSRLFLALFPVLLAGAGVLTWLDVSVGDPFGHFWLALLSGDIVILALTWDSKLSSLVFNNPVLIWLGLRSYGIYLLHKPVQIIVTWIFQYFALPQPGGPWGLMLIYTLCLIPLVEISFRLVEKPLLGLGQRFKYQMKESQ